MKRDMELVVKLLMKIEERSPGESGLDWPEGYDEKLMIDHLFIMSDAGLILGLDASSRAGRHFTVTRMTWFGHEFLDSVRKGDIWDQLKAKLRDAPFEAVFDIAKSYAKKRLGLET